MYSECSFRLDVGNFLEYHIGRPEDCNCFSTLIGDPCKIEVLPDQGEDTLNLNLASLKTVQSLSKVKDECIFSSHDFRSTSVHKLKRTSFGDTFLLLASGLTMGGGVITLFIY